IALLPLLRIRRQFPSPCSSVFFKLRHLQPTSISTSLPLLRLRHKSTLAASTRHASSQHPSHTQHPSNIRGKPSSPISLSCMAGQVQDCLKLHNIMTFSPLAPSPSPPPSPFKSMPLVNFWHITGRPVVSPSANLFSPRLVPASPQKNFSIFDFKSSARLVRRCQLQAAVQTLLRDRNSSIPLICGDWALSDSRIWVTHYLCVC
ncbi:hypothetical protein DFH06DRAFT_472709, partial [Mycena polygramma]